MSKVARFSSLTRLLVFSHLVNSIHGLYLSDAGVPAPPPMPFSSEACLDVYANPVPNCNNYISTQGCSSQCSNSIVASVQIFASQCTVPFLTPPSLVDSLTTQALNKLCVSLVIQEPNPAGETTTSGATKLPSSTALSASQETTPVAFPTSPTISTILVPNTSGLPSAPSVSYSQSLGVPAPTTPPPAASIETLPSITPLPSASPLSPIVLPPGVTSTTNIPSNPMPGPPVAPSSTFPSLSMLSSATSSPTSLGSIGADESQRNKQLTAVVGGLLGGIALISLLTGTILYIVVKRLRCRVVGGSSPGNYSWNQQDPERATRHDSLPPRFSDMNFISPIFPAAIAQPTRSDSVRSYRTVDSALCRNDSVISHGNTSHSNRTVGRCNALGMPTPEFRDAEWAHLQGEQLLFRQPSSARSMRSPPPTIMEEREIYTAAVYEMPVPSPRPVPPDPRRSG